MQVQIRKVLILSTTDQSEQDEGELSANIVHIMVLLWEHKYWKPISFDNHYQDEQLKPKLITTSALHCLDLSWVTIRRSP